MRKYRYKGKKRKEPAIRQIKIIIEKHPDSYVAYPLGIRGIVVGQGDSYEEALADINSAIQFHQETFGESALQMESALIAACVTETGI